MNFIQEVLNLLDRKQDKKKLDLRRDWFEFGRTRPSSVGNPLYTPKMNPHAIKFDDLKCNIISGLVSGTGTEHTLPVWSTVDSNNCNVQTIIDSVFSQDATATEGKVSADFRVTGNTVLEGDLLVLGTQTIVESTIVQVADNIMRINSGGAGVDAGIEVIQPGGTRTWAWDNAKDLWSTFSHSIETKDIVINRAIVQDGETLVNVVNEAEGLASNDNDESYATVAAIIDWTDQMDLEVSADTGTPLDILLNSETLQIRGGSNITTNADGAEKIRIDLDDDINVNSVTTKFLTLGGAPAPYQVTSIVNDINDTVDPNLTLLTVKGIVNYIDAERDYLSNVVLTGTDLTFTGVNNAFSGTIDLSSLLDDTNLARIISGAVVGTDLVLTRDDASDISIDLSTLVNVPETLTTLTYVGDTVSGVDQLTYTDENGNTHNIGGLGTQILSLSGTDLSIVGPDGVIDNTVSLAGLAGGPSVPVMSATVAGTGKLWDDTVQVEDAAPVTAVTQRTYGVQFNDAQQLVVNVPWIEGSGSIVVGNPGSPTQDLTSISIDGTVYGISSGTGADGNDFVSNVTFDSNTSVLDFTGSGGAFNGSINLASLASTETLTTLQKSGDLLIYIDENGNGTNVNLAEYKNADQNLWANIAVAGQQTITANTTTDTLEFVAGAGIQLQTNTIQKKVFITNTLTDTNDIDYVSSVALNGSNLDFTGTGNAFAGSIDLSSLSTTETLTTLTANGNILTYKDEEGNPTEIDLSLYLDDTNLARLVNGTLDGATGIATFTRDDATTFTLDLSSLIDVDTNTTYDLGAAGAAGNINFALSGSDGSNDVVTMQAGTNITLTDNGSNTFTIDAAGGTDTNTTYELGSRQTGSDADIILAGSDSSGNAVKLVAGTNIKLTDNGSNEITIDSLSDSTAVACITGITAVNSTQTLTSSYASIQDGAVFPLGFENISGETRSYALTWTIQYSMTGTTGLKGFDTEVLYNGTMQLFEFNDSAYMASELSVSRTYTYNATGIPAGGTLEIRVKGNIGLTLEKASLNIVATDCEAIGGGEIILLPVVRR